MFKQLIYVMSLNLTTQVVLKNKTTFSPKVTQYSVIRILDNKF